MSNVGSSGAYTADNIAITVNLQQIRRKPTGAIGTKDVAGQTHMIREIIDNSVDELILSTDGGTIDILLMRDVVNDKYQMVISDNGRGIPYGKLKAVCTILGASGKGEDGAYTASGGQFGYGLKAAAALSTRFRILSANHADADMGTVMLKDAEVIGDYTAPTDGNYGVSVVFEPDFSKNKDGQGIFFNDGPAFMNAGYMEVIKICRQLNIFNPKLRFVFKIIDRIIPEEFWTQPIAEARATVRAVHDDLANELVYDSSMVPDKTDYLFELWKCTSNVIFHDTYRKDPRNASDRLGFDVKLYFSNKSATGNPQYFISVNNVSLVDVLHNSATTGFLQVLRNCIASRITDNDTLAEFVRKEYRFNTMMLAIGIRYNLADHAGITKSSFSDSVFENAFMRDMNTILATLGVEYVDRLLGIIRPDIESRFASLHNTPVRNSDSKRTFMDLERNKHYKESKLTGPNCEIYIVEGTSAGNIIEARDNNTQAIYTTRGKPTNPATNIHQIASNRDALLKDPVYKDFMKISNISPNTTDVAKVCRFGKIIIAADADPDGVHITAIHLHNLYIINPRIIESGIVYVAQPPLYSMDLDRSKRLFLRDDIALCDARINYLYSPALEVSVISTENNTEVYLEQGSVSFRDMVFLVNYVGDLMTIMANQLNIPLLILERLVLAINYLYPKIDYAGLEDYFTMHYEHDDSVTIQVDEVGRYIVISVGNNDYTIGLDNIGDAIYTNLYPFIMKYHINDYLFKIRSRLKGSKLSEPQVVSMMTLYIALSNLNKLCKISRYKGLGELPLSDIFETVMNPSTRSLIHITGVGDIESNYSLLGSDSSARKRLLTDTSALSRQFINTHLSR